MQMHELNGTTVGEFMTYLIWNINEIFQPFVCSFLPLAVAFRWPFNVFYDAAFHKNRVPVSV